jgi:hypothetical protein
MAPIYYRWKRRVKVISTNDLINIYLLRTTRGVTANLLFSERYAVSLLLMQLGSMYRLIDRLILSQVSPDIIYVCVIV